jgi:hypothetical protein
MTPAERCRLDYLKKMSSKLDVTGLGGNLNEGIPPIGPRLDECIDPLKLGNMRRSAVALGTGLATTTRLGCIGSLNGGGGGE